MQTAVLGDDIIITCHADSFITASAQPLWHKRSRDSSSIFIWVQFAINLKVFKEFSLKQLLSDRLKKCTFDDITHLFALVSILQYVN